MPSWKSVADEIRAQDEETRAQSAHDLVRRKHLKALHDKTGRNVIVYYSGYFQKKDIMPGFGGFSVDDADKSGLMATIHGLDRTKGLDLFLHTPGGSIAATESIVDYLRSMFGNDVRAIVPQIAMSAGTMIALSTKEVLMGKHSSLGPIDPQIGGIPAHGVIEEFSRALAEIKADPSAVYIWQPIIQKYNPTLIGECQKAINWAEKIVRDWLLTGMFHNVTNASATVDKIMSEFGDHALTLSHARHISAAQAISHGVNVKMLEDDTELQDLVLTVHHACLLSIQSTSAFKIIENQNGIAHVLGVAMAGP